MKTTLINLGGAFVVGAGGAVLIAGDALQRATSSRVMAVINESFDIAEGDLPFNKASLPAKAFFIGGAGVGIGASGVVVVGLEMFDKIAPHVNSMKVVKIGDKVVSGMMIGILGVPVVVAVNAVNVIDEAHRRFTEWLDDDQLTWQLTNNDVTGRS